MSFISHDSSERLKQKRNALLYYNSQETKYDKKQLRSYEQKHSLFEGETVFHEECPDVPWCGSTSPDLFIFRFMLKNAALPISSVLQFVPIINREGSFKLETDVTKESNYLIIRVRGILLRTDSACDGISFYDIESPLTPILNNAVSGLEIIQFGNIPLSRQGSQFRDLNIKIGNTVPVILPDTSFDNIFKNSPISSLNTSEWDVTNVISMANAFTNCANLEFDVTGWDVSNVANMNGMFDGCSSFNQDLYSWDVSNVTSMIFMFRNCFSFNQDIVSWDVFNVEDMSGMFYGCTILILDLTSWPNEATHDNFNVGAPDVIPPNWA
jgi:surface protein